MNKFLLATTSICGLLFVQGVPARADADLDARAKDPKQWVMQQGDDANTRYSKLNQINATNVKKLQVAWTFSTGVLRGHEGGPLVVGDTMYVHTPFPNTVYALDLNNEGKMKKIPELTLAGQSIDDLLVENLATMRARVESLLNGG